MAATATSEDNLCGVDLLGLVARGHIILTEILTLSERIPPAFVAAAAASASAAAADEATSSANKRATSSAASSYVWSLFGGRKGVKQDAPIQDGDDEGIYAQFLFDFRYLRDPEECRTRVNIVDLVLLFEASDKSMNLPELVQGAIPNSTSRIDLSMRLSLHRPTLGTLLTPFGPISLPFGYPLEPCGCPSANFWLHLNDVRP